jgi:glycosyltransferase involved in cell wall biosynthesis
MRILLLHNRYREPGGEDDVVAAEAALLAAPGDAVLRLEVCNAGIGGLASQARAAAGTIYSPAARRAATRAISRFGPDVVHVHNFVPLLSPAVHLAARRAGVPVVQTVHNYRLVCPNGLLFRDGRPCEACVGRAVPWRSLVHGCYRGSRAATAAIVAMLATHRALRTWTRAVSAYIAPSQFARRTLIRGGIPPGRVHVKPHFVDGQPAPGDGAGGYALYVGRLSDEKGLGTLLAAWRGLGGRIPLKIVGDGPTRLALAAASRDLGGVEWVGRAPPERVRALMQSARVVVVPSRCYETFGRVIIEAFSVGTPVIAARHGALAELVQHERTGLLFEPGSAPALASAVARAFDAPAAVRAALRRAARTEFEGRYGPARNYALLMETYARAREAGGPRARAPAPRPEEGRPWIE